jgi:hypothetical protein
VTKYNWSHIIEIVAELLPQATDYSDLADAVNARVQIPRTTLRDGLARELGLEERSLESVKAALLPEDKRLSNLATALLGCLRKERDTAFSLVELCERFDRAPTSVEAAASELRDNDYYVEVSDDRHILMPNVIPKTGGVLPVEVWTIPTRIHRHGLVSDTHIANRHSRLDVLNTLYDIFQEEGVETVLHMGNIVDGEFRYNRHELLAHGVEGQIAFLAKHYPQRDGITTKFITGECHEGWWAKDIGLDIGRRLENGLREHGRNDFVWLGHIERDLELDPNNGRSVLRLLHPGGGTAYATSYKPQKIVESWQGGEKPAAAYCGHYHKEGKFYPREVHFVLAACVCDQTSFMRKKPTPAHVGGSIVEIHLSEAGFITRFKYDFIPFYDRGFYEDWDYASMWANE